MRLVQAPDVLEFQRLYSHYLKHLKETKQQNHILYSKSEDLYESAVDSLRISYNELMEHISILEAHIEHLDDAVKNLLIYLLELNGNLSLLEK